MKKSVIALTMVLALGAGVAATTGNAHMQGGGPGYGYGMMNGGCGRGPGMMGGYGRAGVNDAEYQKFLEGTTTLRKAIAVDRAELEAVMAGKDPDPKRVRELTATIVDNQEKLAEAARKAGVGGPGFCNGPCGNGRGFDRDND